MEKVSGTSVHPLLMRVCCWGERLCFGMKSQGKDRRWHSQMVPSQGSFAEGCSVPRDTWAQGFQLCFLVSKGMSFPARARARCQGILSIFLPSFPPSLDSRDAWSFSERCETGHELFSEPGSWDFKQHFGCANLASVGNCGSSLPFASWAGALLTPP